MKPNLHQDLVEMFRTVASQRTLFLGQLRTDVMGQTLNDPTLANMMRLLNMIPDQDRSTFIMEAYESAFSVPRADAA